MTDKHDLLLSILVLDAYSQGQNRGHGHNRTTIGTAVKIAEAIEEPDCDADFQAVAYCIGEGEDAQTIVSYRGTDNLPSDAASGYLLTFSEPYNDYMIPTTRFPQPLTANTETPDAAFGSCDLGRSLPQTPRSSAADGSSSAMAEPCFIGARARAVGPCGAGLAHVREQGGRREKRAVASGFEAG